MRNALSAILITLPVVMPLHATEPGSHDWTRTNTLLASVYVASELADWDQTRQICRFPNLHEVNSALGSHPSAGQINRHFLKCTVIDLAVAYLLKKTCPAWVSYAYLMANIGIEIDCISTNYRNGIKIQFGMKF